MAKQKTSQKAAHRFTKAKRGVNLSRKEIFAAQRKIWEEKQAKVEADKNAARRARVESIRKMQNKKTHKTFDRHVMQCVQEGLTEAITALGEAVTPLSLFMSTFTALNKSPEAHQTPYMLTILCGCIPRLSQAVLLRQSPAVFRLCEQLLAEYANTNHLITAKTHMLAQTLLLNVEKPTEAQVAQLRRLEPSKLQQESMALYLGTFRKLLEQAALGSVVPDDDDDNNNSNSSGAAAAAKAYEAMRQVKDPQTGLFTLTDAQRFYVAATPAFVEACLGNLSDSPAAVARASVKELCSFFSRTLSPVIIESSEGAQLINTLLGNQIVSVLKPVHQAYWAEGMTIIETVCDRLNYLKRVRAPNSSNSNSGQQQVNAPAVPFCSRFPSATFVLRVLNKIRVMDDPDLNARTERAMVALGKAMTVQEFVEILPFDPQAAYERETSLLPGDPEGEAELARLWSTSYTFNVVRRIASHDSLVFLVEHFFPMIVFCGRASAEAEAAKRVEEKARWVALLAQLWRIAVGFCHYPTRVTDMSFRDLAKRLVALLSTPLLIDTAATAIHILCDSYYKLSREEEEDEDDEYFLYPNAASTKETERLEDDMRETGAKSQQEQQQQQRRRRLRQKGSLEEDNYFLSMNDPTWNPHKYHGISRAYAQEVCAIFAKYSANIMPKLCNTFEAHDSTAVLLAIQSFSMVCDPAVMTSILKGILDVSSNIALQAQRKANAAIADVENPGAPRPAGNAPLTDKRRMVLDIACAVVPQLSQEHLTTLLRNIVEPVLEDPSPESRLLQKKAYKLLYAMFEHRVRDIFPMFREIASSLAVGRHTISISGVKMRIRCLSWALDACKIYYPEDLLPFVQSIMAEVIMFARSKSSEARVMTMDVLERIDRYVRGAGITSSRLLRMVMQGLAGRSEAMIASTLVCVAKLVYLSHASLPAEDLSKVMGIGFKLMESTMSPVRASAAVFTRMALKLAKRSPAVLAAVEQNLPKLLLAIATVTSQEMVSSSVRVQMRVLLEKAIKRFTYERIDPIFPLGSKNFLRYTYKMYRRDQRKEAKHLEKHQSEQRDEFNRLFLGLSLHAGEDDAGDDLLEAGALTSFVSRHAAPSFQGFGGGAAVLGGDSDDDEEHGGAAGVRRGAGGVAATGGRKDTDEFSRNMHLDFTADGKLRILSREEKAREEQQRAREAMANRLLGRAPLLDPKTLEGDAQRGNKRGNKRGREDMEDYENEQLMLRYNSKATDATVERELSKLGAGAAAAGAAGSPGALGGRAVGPSALQVSRMRDQKSEQRALKRQRVEEDIRKGDEFRGTGAGDIKRGNLEPYAYVPLNRRYMNKRNAREALHRFEVVHHKNLQGEKARAVAESTARKRKGDKK